MNVVQELRLSMKRMLNKLFPWQRGLLTASSDDYVTTSQLIETVDALICNGVTDAGDDRTQVRLCSSVYFLIAVIVSFIVPV